MNQLMIISKKRERYQQLITQQMPEQLELTNEIAEATIILGEPPLIRTKLPQATQLQWVQSLYAGVEPLIHAPAATDYQLTNIKHGMGELISEYVIGYTIVHLRHLLQYHHLQQQQLWQPLPYQPLHKQKMLIVGTGAIGQTIAKSVATLGIKCVGLNKTGQTVEGFQQCYSFNDPSDAIEQATIIVVVIPATSETYQLVNEAFFSKMKQALFFNVGRGSTVSEKALLKALEQKQVQHAYLDVFEQEPLNPSHPFWSHSKVTITPHIAANTIPEEVLPIFLENYTRYVNHQPLHGVVDKQKGY